MPTRKSQKSSIEKRQKEAVVRQAAYDALSTAEKLDRLDKQFGTGKGATRVREKLNAIATLAKLQEKFSGDTSKAENVEGTENIKRRSRKKGKYDTANKKAE